MGASVILSRIGQSEIARCRPSRHEVIVFWERCEFWQFRSGAARKRRDKGSVVDEGNNRRRHEQTPALDGNESVGDKINSVDWISPPGRMHGRGALNYVPRRAGGGGAGPGRER